LATAIIARLAARDHVLGVSHQGDAAIKTVNLALLGHGNLQITYFYAIEPGGTGLGHVGTLAHEFIRFALLVIHNGDLSGLWESIND
jgi:hypothetical protein